MSILPKIVNTLLVVLTVGLLQLPINAQAAAVKNGFSVSPPTFDLQANPGDVQSNVIKIENVSDHALKIKARMENFVAYGEGGQVNFTEEDSSYSVNTWVTFEKSEFELQAKAVYLFKFKLNIPTNAEAGSHYGAVVFSTEQTATEPNAPAVLQEVGSIILIKIPGDVVESGKVVSFTSEKDRYTDPKIKLTALIENTGSIHFKSFGTIAIKDIFGNVVKTITIDGKNILPDSRRIFDEIIDFDQFGYFTAKLEMFYNTEKTKTLTAETTFWAFNTGRSIPIALTILAIILIYALFRKRISKAVSILIKG